MKVLLITCVLSWPVEGPVVEPYAPIGSYGGHWGIDIGAEPGSPIRSPVGGSVAFAGSVAGMRTVSIVSASGLRVSLSYLSSIGVGQGDRVESGQVVGRSGSAHGADAIHMSVRVDGRYVNPLPLLSCRYDLAAGLRLLEPEVRAS